jgi:hypothetical protein
MSTMEHACQVTCDRHGECKTEGGKVISQIRYSAGAVIRMPTWRTKGATLRRSAGLAHASHTRLIVFKFLVPFSFDIALHHQVSEIRIASDVHDAAGG